MLSFFSDESVETKEDGTASSFNSHKKPTIGVEFQTKLLLHPSGAKIKSQIWDTAGQERYRAITRSHYRRAAGAMLVYDVTNRRSFENAKAIWLSELRESSDSDNGLLSCIAIVGNKMDLAQEGDSSVTEEEQLEFAKQNNLVSYRTSARTGANIKEAFTDLIFKVHDSNKSKKVQPTSSRVITSMGDSSKSKKGNCC